MRKKIFAVAVSAALALSMIPLAFAEDEPADQLLPVSDVATEAGLFERLMSAETVEDLLSLMEAAGSEALEALSADEVDALFELVEAFDPTGGTDAVNAVVDMLVLLPGFVSGAEQDGEEAATNALPSGYIYFDLSLGSVTITQDKYTGFDPDGNEKTGTHKNTNKYYIFQGNGEKGKYTNSLPSYSNVTYNGQDWGDYVTNHPSRSTAGDDSVDEVIAAWDAADKGSRTVTSNRIEVSTTKSNTTFNVTIDNIWSSRQVNGSSSIPALSFKAIGTELREETGRDPDTYLDCATNVTVNLTVKGDNRFGRIHCATHDGQNRNYISDVNHTNVINISGDTDATLTVANMTENLTGTKGAHTSALIGGTDRLDHSFRMAFDMITVYAGGGRLDFGTAIGGGGNGDGRVTINGGSVTAVNSATGTAIGGGCGTAGVGGYGNVTINGGEVYAYAYKPHYTSEESTRYTDAMPTAIGGGSSGTREGGTGIVKITGGYVYAYSEVGNAIGGGGGGDGYYTNSEIHQWMSTSGGTADVSISGGTVDAVSGAGCAIGGGPGGGRAYTDETYEGSAASTGELPYLGYVGATEGDRVNADGGTAKLTISGSPVIRSGSIGGGSPLDENRAYGATVGAAVVNVSGGTIHGQIVMDGVIKNAPAETGLTNGDLSSFTMSGGLIDNTPIGGEYHFVEENGGAVYVSSGSATMIGGTIRDCEAPLGGAVYVIGGNFALSGSGKIVDVSATTSGGAAYVADGSFTMSGGTIENATAPNGGAAYVDGGNVAMSGGAIEDCWAVTHGGAVYVTGGSMTMSGGTIDGGSIAANAKKGGAAYVAGGGFAMTGGTMTSNAASADGGAVYAAGGQVTIGLEGCDGSGHVHPVLSGNTAVNGGAIAVSGSNPVIYCGTLSANSASVNGGAVYVHEGSIIMHDGAITGGGLAASAVNGGAIYVDGGAFELRGGSLTSNYASQNGGAAYVDGGSVNMYGGTIGGSAEDGNKALNGGAAYVVGGNFNMISGKMSYNTAVEKTSGAAEAGDEGYGGAVYAAKSGEKGGSVVIGVGGCTGIEPKHTGSHTDLPHPVVNNNEAEFGGGFAVNGGSVEFHCGTVKDNKTDSAGTGMNVFMQDGDIEHYMDQSFIGETTDHGMVSTGGVLTVHFKENGTQKHFIVQLIYNPNIDDEKYFDVVWEGEAPSGYYLNLPYCPKDWQEWQEKEGLGFVGWTETPVDINSGTIRSTENYKPLGTPVEIRDTTEGDNENIMKFYAVWAPKTSSISYAYVLDDGPAVEIMDYADYNGPKTYEYTINAKAVEIGKPSKSGYTFVKWVLYAEYGKDKGGESERQVNISNWGSDAESAPKAPTKYEEIDAAALKSLEGGTLDTLQNFGDITLVAVFEPHVLTIEKTVTGGLDEGQTFLFQVTGANGFKLTVALGPEDFDGGKASATVRLLPEGTYTVTEIADWSWRYELDSAEGAYGSGKEISVNQDGVATVVLGGAETKASVSFANDRLNGLWLSGDSFVRNIFKAA